MTRWLAVAIIVGALAPRHARADARADVRAAIDAQVKWLASGSSPANHAAPRGMFAADVVVSLPESALERGAAALFADVVAACGTRRQPKLDDYAATLAPDAASAWVSFTLAFESCASARALRASELLVLDGGWRVAVVAWSRGEPNDRVNDAARKRERAPIALGKGPSDASIAAAVADLVKHGVDGTAAASKDLVVFGSGPGERTRGGGGFAAAWKTAWMSHVTIDGPLIADAAPGGGAAWAIANLVLAKQHGNDRYTIPFRAFLVFAKATDGTWSLAHVHLAVAMAPETAAAASGCAADVEARARKQLSKSHHVEDKFELACVTGRFRVNGKIVRAAFVELGYEKDDGTRAVARSLMSPDGARELRRLADGARGNPEHEETLEALDLDGDGVDEVFVTNYAYARAEIHQVYVKGIDGPDSNFLRYAIDVRPKGIESYCEGTIARERVGAATHLIVTTTVIVGDDVHQCLSKGRHVFVYEHGKLVESPARK